MIYETTVLSEKYPDCTLTSYVCDINEELKIGPRRAVIVCPGGGYIYLSDREAEPIVRSYFGAGMNVYLLRYSVNEKAADFAPLIESALAVKYVREHASEHNTDPEKIFICGFSAGGHLAASCGILWNSAPVRAALGIDEGKAPEGINRPDGMILSYPVITGGEFRHVISINKVCGKDDPTEEERDVFSLEKHVDPTTPPAFIWHTFSDTAVPVENSLMLMNSFVKVKVPFEAHIYPSGSHGLALANEETCCLKEKLIVKQVQSWMPLSIEWMKTI